MNPLSSFTVNVHPDAVFNTVLHYNRKYIPFILAYTSLDSELLNLQMEDTNQDIQDATID